MPSRGNSSISRRRRTKLHLILDQEAGANIYAAEEKRQAARETRDSLRRAALKPRRYSLPAEGGDSPGAHDASAKGLHGLTPNPPPIKPEGKDVGS